MKKEKKRLCGYRTLKRRIFPWKCCRDQNRKTNENNTRKIWSLKMFLCFWNRGKWYTNSCCAAFKCYSLSSVSLFLRSNWRFLNRSFQFCQHKRVNKWFQTTFRCCGLWIWKVLLCVARLKRYCLCLDAVVAVSFLSRGFR